MSDLVCYVDDALLEPYYSVKLQPLELVDMENFKNYLDVYEEILRGLTCAGEA